MTLRVKDLIPYLDENTRVFLVDGNIRFDIDSPLADSCFGRFIDRIAGAAGEKVYYFEALHNNTNEVEVS